jgi:LmbE family N-acetylglucosaminyl deacetylase
MIDGLRKVVAFFAHSDDEMIAAGTFHRLARQGCDVDIIAFAYAAVEEDRKGYGSTETKNYKLLDTTVQIHDEWKKSASLIGAKNHCRALKPSCDFQPHRQTICQYVFDYCEQEKPDAVFTLSPDDENTAHSIVGVECERVTRGRVPIHVRCQFPWNYSIGRPNLFVKLDESDVQCKRDVINAYQSQKFRYDYEEMLMAAVRLDGLSVKAEYAEKFELVRGVV